MFEVTASLKEIFTFTKENITPDVYKRLCNKIGAVYPAEALSGEETSRLASNLGCGETLGLRVIQAVYFLYSKASYNTTKPGHVQAFLVPLLGEENAGVFAEAWSNHAVDIVARLKVSRISNKYNCTKMAWESTVSISSDQAARLSDTEAVLQITAGGETSNVAFNYEGLMKFYGELEKIQSAADNLAS